MQSCTDFNGTPLTLEASKVTERHGYVMLGCAAAGEKIWERGYKYILGVYGLDAYKKILEIHPGQKAIVASAFSETDRVKEVQSLGAGAYIKKPFLSQQIGIAVR